MRRTFLLAGLSVLLTGCAGDAQYFLVDAFPYKEVCLVDNKNVPASFFLALRTALEDKGLKVRTVNKILTNKDKCPAYINYTASYKKTAGQTYLSSARLSLVKRGDTEAITVQMRKDPTQPSTLLDPMADQVPAVRRLVNRLLPRDTPW